MTVKHKACKTEVVLKRVTVNTIEPGIAETVGEYSVWCEACSRFVSNDSLSKRGPYAALRMPIGR